MKFTRLTTEDFDLEEKFLSPSVRSKKYQKHVVDQKEFGKHMTKESYEQAADRLANSRVDYRSILGYVAVDNKGQQAYIKYNTKTEEYVVYHRSPEGDPIIVTFYHRPLREFTGKKALEYVDELPATE